MIGKIFSNSWVCWIIGALLVIVPIGIIGENLFIRFNGTSTEGEISDIAEMQSLRSSGESYRVTFRTEDGNRFEVPVTTTGLEFNDGDEVTVIYLPNDPERAIVVPENFSDEVPNFLMLPIGLFLGGWLIIRGVNIWRTRKQKIVE
jgi:hypothetical protein